MTHNDFWFLLLESASCLPYKGTTADYVSLPPDADIDDFLKAVHAKNSSILPGIVPSQLLVHKNKAAFDRRNHAKDEGKGEPLNASHSIGALGSMEDMLVVVVPPLSRPPYQQTTQPTSLKPCSLPLFNSIQNINERHGWISFGQERIPSTSLNSLYIRECYRTIASRILEVNGIHKAIITGTLGIGKSLFLFYLLWRLVKEGKRVLFIYGPYVIYYDGTGGVFSFDFKHLPLSNDISFWNDTLWCLFDVWSKTESDLVRLPVEFSTFIVSISPRREMVYDFKKPPVPQVFNMPTWTEAELESISPFFPEAKNEWRDRFIILGGIPRYVVEVTTQTPIKIIEEACRSYSLDDIIAEKSVFPMVHITSIPPFTKSSVCYASPTAPKIILRHKSSEVIRKMHDILASCEGNPLTDALCAYIFEPYTLELLERGGTFTCRQLVGGKTEIQPIETTLEIPSSEKRSVDAVLPDQTLNQLHVPEIENYAAIDAWIPGIGAFQMTVGKKHAIKCGARDDLAKLGGGNRLYWLLPPLYYDSFTKKSPHDIEQHAVRIPYPENSMRLLSLRSL